MPKTKKQSKTRQVLNCLKPTSPAKGMLLFAIVFAVIGGSYLAYKSFAAAANPYPCPAPQPTIQAFSTGNCVKYLQYVLINNAYQSKVIINGNFDAATVMGVKNVQLIAGLKADGIVGP